MVCESKIQFTDKKMKEDDVTDVSMPLFEFQQVYSSFCYKNGYDEILSFEEEPEQKVLKNYKISVKNFEDKLEPAYIHLRFKTIKEKSEAVLQD